MSRFFYRSLYLGARPREGYRCVSFMMFDTNHMTIKQVRNLAENKDSVEELYQYERGAILAEDV